MPRFGKRTLSPNAAAHLLLKLRHGPHECRHLQHDNKGSTRQRFNVSTVQRFNGSTVQRFKGLKKSDRVWTGSETRAPDVCRRRQPGGYIFTHSRLGASEAFQPRAGNLFNIQTCTALRDLLTHLGLTF